MEKPKAVFTFVEAGMGHIMPITGIADAFEKKYGDKFEVIRWKIFSETKNPIIKKYGNYIVSWVKMACNNKMGAIEEKISYMFGSKLSLKFLDAKFKKAKEAVIKEIEKVNPALICSTYYSPSHFALEARKRNLINSVIATYTPDPVVYPAWDRRSDVFFVNNASAYKHAKKTGFKKEQLVQVPFVARKEILEITKDKNQARQQLNLPTDKFTVLLTSGAYGTNKHLKVVDAILEKNLDITLAVVCGKNETLYNYCKNLKLPENHKTTFHFVGFTDKMFVYNSAANLILGKCGSNSIMEAFHFNVPFFVIAYGNLLEKYTSNYFIKEQKCGEKIFNPKKLANKIEEIANNPSLLDVYTQNIKQFQDATGAEKIADHLYEMLKIKFNI